MNSLSRDVARNLIAHLKSGSTPLESVQYINVGNEQWFVAAEELFADIEVGSSSLVRFINGYYGDGKTHFLGMLQAIALARRWIVSYVTAENTPLNKFDIVYAEVVKNMILPADLPYLQWLPACNQRGPGRLLGCFFSKWYLELHSSGDKTGLNDMGVIQGIRERSEKIMAYLGLNELVASAVRAYMRAALCCNAAGMNQVAAWIEGSPILIKEVGVNRRVDQKLARDVLRAISLLVRACGAKGVLLLLDEAERIMDQSRSVRKKSYGLIRRRPGGYALFHHVCRFYARHVFNGKGICGVRRSALAPR
jgi:hypothetical protein